MTSGPLASNAPHGITVTLTVQRYAGIVGVVFLRLYEPDPEDRPVRGEGNTNKGWAGVPQRREPCDPHECEAVIGTCLWSGGQVALVPMLQADDGGTCGCGDLTCCTYRVRSTGRPFDEVEYRIPACAVQRLMVQARIAGVWRDTEHCRTKRYSELDPTAPSAYSMEVVL